ncbi:sulfotransferase domain-containing protein [Pelagibacterales bacterium SAG-MED31]|nr:sulfotransferase domain-containing protein [Pelagibacterales bacterium SAG-MED31]
MSNHIFWLCSYPKSGNTLIRLIIAALFFTKDGVVNLDLIKYISNFESTRNLNFIKDKNKNDFNNLNKLEILSKYLIESQSKKNLGLKEDFGFFKTHSANMKIINYNFTKVENIRGFIYIVRDPRDVIISWSHYANISIAESVKFITNKDACINWINSENSFLDKKIIPQVFLSTWDTHVTSWIYQLKKTPKLIIKYEEIVEKKKETILKIIDFFENNYKIKFINIENKLNNIIKTTTIKNLQKEEKNKLKDQKLSNPFFRIGKSKQWKNVLTNEQNKLICEKFGETMKVFDYI